MWRCIFCDTELTPDTKPEHILLDAFGGRKVVYKIVCSRCNGDFGGTIDSTLAAQTVDIRNMFALKSGSGDPPPTIKNVEVGGRRVNILGDGSFEILDKPFTVTYAVDGTPSIRFNLNSIDDLSKYIPHVAAQLKLPVERVKEVLLNSSATATSQPAGVRLMNVQFGGEDAIRAAAKACFVLWASVVGNDEVRREPYAAARSYIRFGDAAFTSGRTDLDARHLPNEADIVERYDGIFNLIYVRSDNKGRLIGHYTINNMIGFWIVLTEQGAIPDAIVGAIHVAPAHSASKPPRGSGGFGARDPDLSATSTQLITPALVAAVSPLDMLHPIRIES